MDKIVHTELLTLYKKGKDMAYGWKMVDSQGTSYTEPPKFHSKEAARDDLINTAKELSYALPIQVRKLW